MGFKVQGIWFRIQGAGFGVHDSRFSYEVKVKSRVEGSEIWV